MYNCKCKVCNVVLVSVAEEEDSSSEKKEDHSSPEHKKESGDKKRRDESSPPERKKKKKEESEDDEESSPPERKKKGGSEKKKKEESEERKKKKKEESEDDEESSPPERKKKGGGEKKKKEESEDDEESSPPERRKKEEDPSEDSSSSSDDEESSPPERKKKKKEEESSADESAQPPHRRMIACNGRASCKCNSCTRYIKSSSVGEDSTGLSKKPTEGKCFYVTIVGNEGQPNQHRNPTGKAWGISKSPEDRPSVDKFIHITRGKTYYFIIKQSYGDRFKFYITADSVGGPRGYCCHRDYDPLPLEGSEQPRSNGVMVFRPDENTPSIIYYNCRLNPFLGGIILVHDPKPKK